MCAAGTLPQGLHKLYVATRHLLRELRAKFIRRSYRRVAPAEELPIAPRPPAAVCGAWGSDFSDSQCISRSSATDEVNLSQMTDRLDSELANENFQRGLKELLMAPTGGKIPFVKEIHRRRADWVGNVVEVRQQEWVG